MIKASYDWQLVEAPVDSSFEKIAKKEGLTKAASQLLYERGIQTEEALATFLHPSLDQLHAPYLLHDMDKAVERIRRAIENYEQILIYGDYDADGMTSASIMKEALEELGAEIQVYLPNRFTDGYGPNISVYKYFIEQQGVSLVLTVDNGVAGVEAIAYAQGLGVDVVVTDHHALPETLPNAYAIVHPEHPEGDYPFKHLAGCGVAFKLACALLETIQTELLDLVAIGTIADMVSLTGENRIMVQYGLNMLKHTQRMGLQELFRVAGIDPDTLDEETVGFQIAPRLNALGRLDDPNPAIELLTGFDDEEAAEIAQLIDQKNTERKEVVQVIFDQAKAMVDPTKTAQVLAKEGWNPGVLGIVAGRLQEELHQPIIVLSIEDGKAKGSARSPEVVNIFEALSPKRDELFLAFGGHAGAAGMTLEVDKLALLQETLIDFIAANHIDLNQKNQLLLDEELDLEEISLDTVRAFEKLAPYGMDHKRPVFYLKDFQVESARTMGQNGVHLKFRIQKGGAKVDVVAFGKGHLATEVAQVKHLELAVTLSVNEWNGTTGLQLLLVDMRVVGVQLYDIRSRAASLPTGVPVLDFTDAVMLDAASDGLVISTLPEDLKLVREVLLDKDIQALYFKNTLQTTYYLDGYGTRDQYAKLYKTIYQYPEFDVRYKLKELSRHLSIQPPLLVKMIQIFEELGFVTITDGVMTVNKDAERKAIASSQIYQDLQETVRLQELFALGTVEEIYDWLTSEEES